MTQGQSSATIKKEAAIQTCLRYVLKAVKPQRYFVFDLNCGCGENRSNGANCKGTGPLARESMRTYGIQGHIWLCDVSRKALREAEQRFFNPQGHLWDPINHRDGIGSSFVRMDNQEFVPTIPQRLREMGINPKTAHGIIIADPNGLKVPLTEIGQCLKECPLIDIAIHLHAVKQVWAFMAKHNGHPMAKCGGTVVRSCSEIFAKVPRSSWLISEPFRPVIGREHYLFFGTSLHWIKPIINLPGRPNMYRSDSFEGRALIAATDRYAEVA